MVKKGLRYMYAVMGSTAMLVSMTAPVYADTPGQDTPHKEEITTLQVQYQPITLDERRSLGMDDFVQEKITRDIASSLIKDTKKSTTSVSVPDPNTDPDTITDKGTSDTVRRAQEALKNIDAYITQQKAAEQQAQQNVQQGTTVYADSGKLPPVLQEQFGVTSNGSSSHSMVIPADVDGTSIKKLLEAAQTQLGVPYVWGGTSPGKGLDCSGFVQWAYSQIGVSLPRVTYQQVQQGKQVSLNDLKPGDLLFPADTSHVSMYIGNGNVIHAPQTGDVVKITPVQYMSVAQARRIVE